jgi:putative tricarboxylic transport membrane protein
MFDLLLAMLLGSAAGIFVGILPGIGPTALLILTYPFLEYFDLWSLFIFYFALLNGSQYYGSVSATVYGVTGELSSIPAVRHGHKLFQLGHGNPALIYAATGSFFASQVALVVFILLTNLDVFATFMSSFWRMIFLSIALISIVFFTKNRLHGLLFAAAGLVIGKIGYDIILQDRILTFGFTELDSGLPFFPLFCGLILIPLLIDGYEQSYHKPVDFKIVTMRSRIKALIKPKHVPSMLRGSVIGFFSGLIPGASYTISSNIADWVENKFFRSTEKLQQHFNGLVAAESANNAGAVSALIPLIALAIPIVSSEAILLSVAETKGFGVNVSLDMLYKNLEIIVVFLFLINLVNWGISGLLYNQIVALYQRCQKYVYHVVGVLCVGVMIYFAWEDYQLYLSIMVFVVSISVGLLVKDIQSKTCFVFAYFISDSLGNEIYRYFL